MPDVIAIPAAASGGASVWKKAGIVVSLVVIAIALAVTFRADEAPAATASSAAASGGATGNVTTTAAAPFGPSDEELAELDARKTGSSVLAHGHWLIDRADWVVGWALGIALLMLVIGGSLYGAYLFVTNMKAPEWEGSYFYLIGFLIFGTLAWFVITGARQDGWTQYDTIACALAAILGLLAIDKHPFKVGLILAVLVFFSIVQGHLDIPIKKMREGIGRAAKSIAPTLVPSRSSRGTPGLPPMRAPPPSPPASGGRVSVPFAGSIFIRALYPREVVASKEESIFLDVYSRPHHQLPRGFTTEPLRYEVVEELDEGVFRAREITDHPFRRGSGAEIIGWWEDGGGRLAYVYYAREPQTSGTFGQTWRIGAGTLRIVTSSDRSRFLTGSCQRRLDTADDPRLVSPVEWMGRYDELVERPAITTFSVDMVPRRG